ncbi:MAG: hypothetical protein AB8G86_16930, partial [Saprospiraceae bacterium]
MSFTNLSYGNLNSLLGRAAFLMLFAWCFSMNAAYAQDAAQGAAPMPSDSTAKVFDDIKVCGANAYVFTDDNSGDGKLYSDGSTRGAKGGRADTTVFCPVNEWSRVQVVFTEFDLAVGDTLFAFQGNLKALNAATVAAVLAATGKDLPAGTTVKDLQKLAGETKAILDKIASTAADSTAANAAAATAAADSTAANAAAAAAKAAADADSNNAAKAAAAKAAADKAAAAVAAAKAAADKAAAAVAAAKAAAEAGTAAVKAAIAAGYLPAKSDLANLMTLVNAIAGVLDAGVGSLPGSGSGSGIGSTNLAQSRSGVSDAFGGWIDADCNPGKNASGCLTFIFNTTNDRKKGTGWEAWVSCGDRGVSLKKPTDIWGSALCDDPNNTGAPVDTLEIAVATLEGFCKDSLTSAMNNHDSVIVKITDAAGATCVVDTLKAGQKLAKQAFAVGTYKVTHTLLIDKEKKQTNYIFVAGPSLTCNDEINVSLGGGCKVVLDADNLLEAPCDSSRGVFYTIVIKNSAGKEIGKTPAAARFGNVVINKDKLTNVCGGDQLTATITRTYDYSNNAGLKCPPANVTETCEVKINVKDDTAPIFSRGPRKDTLVACDTTGLASLLMKPDVI